VHDSRHVKHVRLGVIAAIEDLYTPATVCSFVARCDALSALDVVHLMTCANELVWQSFDFAGIGDWIDARGVQRGAQAIQRGQEPARVAARG
jgi:hypothetical protein